MFDLLHQFHYMIWRLYGAQNPRVPEKIAAETGIKLLRLYSNAGGRPETDTYIKWIDYTVRTLVQTVNLG
jgi:ABC-type Zn uptake system ZnuABC Zn-binding protein ZnuA